jgi:hypothetical protein
MAKCEFCNREMNTAKGCALTSEKVWSTKGVYLGIKRRPKVTPDEAINGRCGDCSAKPGFYHHPGCDIEPCIVCHGQALGCEHYFSRKDRK